MFAESAKLKHKLAENSEYLITTVQKLSIFLLSKIQYLPAFANQL